MTRDQGTIVLKFGGAAVSAPERFASIADIVLARRVHFPRVIVAVSAMGDTTDELIALAHRVHPNPPRREMDMLVSVGERISMSLLAMALDAKGVHARSFTGSQSGILTSPHHAEARIVDVKPTRLRPHLNEGRIVIVAGFQGMSTTGEITTLGRGGTDTTAVALGVALGACKVEFYKDVAGIFDADPKKHPGARLFPRLTYADAFAIMHKGAQVLHDRCVLLAERNALPLHVLPFQPEGESGHTAQPNAFQGGTLILPPEDAVPPSTPAYEPEGSPTNASETTGQTP
jgi:aspartate kinase